MSTKLRGANRKRTEEHHRTTELQIQVRGVDAPDDLPNGVCGRIVGTAVVYGVIDTYGTMFAPGCMARTIAERVRRNKVALFATHNAGGVASKVHIGVLRDIVDMGDAAVMTADIFDSPAGRDEREYMAAAIAAGAEVGLSIGFEPRDDEWVKGEAGALSFLRFKEIALEHVAVTPVPAVPGAGVAGVRAEEQGGGVCAAESEAGSDDDTQGLLMRQLHAIMRSLPERTVREAVARVFPASTGESTEGAAAAVPPVAVPPVTPDADTTHDGTGVETEAGQTDDVGTRTATMDERLRAVRQSFRPL